MIRCADFVFPSTRATVEVVSDADSVCGDVVHETQLVAYETIDIGGGYTDYEFADTDLADPTLSIPIDDVGFEDGLGYVAYIGVKITGAGDIGHRNGEQFMTLSDQNTRIRGYNDVIDDSVYGRSRPLSLLADITMELNTREVEAGAPRFPGPLRHMARRILE